MQATTRLTDGNQAVDSAIGRVLVTGASGFVGNHVIAGLLEAGYDVRGLSRRLPGSDRRSGKAEYVDSVDIGDVSTITAAMFQGVDVVVHLVGIIQQAKGGQTFQRIHVDGTRNIVAAAVASGSVKRFIYMSSIGSAPDAPAEYSRTKFAAEQIVKESGLPYTILRPSIVIGRDGEFVAQMEELVNYGGLPIKFPVPVIPVPGSGANRFQPIHVDDLVACVVRAIGLDAAANATYEVGGASQVTFNELIGGFATALGVKKPMAHAPVAILRVVASVMEAVMPRPPVTRDQLANLGRDNVTKSRAITDVFGVKPLGFDEILAGMYRPTRIGA